MERVQIFDTTLRDGSQAEGISFSVEDKLRIAHRLDELGIDYIEGGWPNATNPKDVAFFRQAARENWKHAKITAFGSTRRADTPPEKDRILKYLVASAAPAVAIFGKSWDLHVTDVLRVDLDENLRMIESSVAYLKSQGLEVIYDAEHFFDGFHHNPEYATKTLQAALAGGADCIVLCDTNGGMLPHQIEESIQAVGRQECLPHQWGIHCHDDGGCGVANTLLAVRLGARHVQGTFLGIGERCGNANLCSILPNLSLKMGFDVLTPGTLRELTAVSWFVSEVANLHHNERLPFVGSCAFAHKGGMHIDGVRKITRSFEHVDPGEIGNSRRFLLSDQSGTSTIVEKLSHLWPGLDKSNPAVAEILMQVKELESQGYQFEAAEASFALLALRYLDPFEPLFHLEGYRVIVETRPEGMYSEATIEVKVGDQVVHTAAEGAGPVDALNLAIRKALRPFYPELDEIFLTDYKVRVLDESQGTATGVRVLIETADSDGFWGTVGASVNVVEASWHALVDSLVYGILKHRGRLGGLAERVPADLTAVVRRGGAEEEAKSF